MKKLILLLAIILPMTVSCQGYWGSLQKFLAGIQLGDSITGSDITTIDSLTSAYSGIAQLHINDTNFVTIGEIPYEADYYVTLWGNDDNPGTFNEPWLTWHKAFTTVVAGDTVYIRGGVYVVPATSIGVLVEYGESGTHDSLICIFNYPGERPILDCSIQNVTGGFNFGVTVLLSDYWHIRGLEVRNVIQGVGESAGGFIIGQSDNMMLENLNVHHIGGVGIEINAATDTNWVINCDSHDNYDPLSGLPGGNADGYSAQGPSRTAVTIFRGCRSFDNSDDGWDTWDFEGVIIYENCWSFSNGYDEGDGNGYKLGRTLESKLAYPQRIMTNCMAVNNTNRGFSQTDGEVDMQLFNTLSYNNGTFGYYFGDTEDADIYIKNSISYGIGYVFLNGVSDFLEATVVIDNYNDWNLDNVTISDADFISLDTMLLFKSRQPDGSLPDTEFGELAQTSDAIDAGTDAGHIYKGHFPDLGAMESDFTNPYAPLKARGGLQIGDSIAGSLIRKVDSIIVETDYSSMTLWVKGYNYVIPLTSPPVGESATAWYFSQSVGNDANNGHSSSFSKQSIAELNDIIADSVESGDIIYLKRGDEWSTEGIDITTSGDYGNLITRTFYGTGELLIIDWTNAVAE